MPKESIVIIIPARLNSSRFPQKILYPINGKPLILHVLDKARQLELCECYVACCCEDVRDLIETHGGKAIVTDPDLQSGTDRVWSAVEKLPTRPDIVINLQGDTPVFDSDIIPKTLRVLLDDGNIDISTPVSFCETLVGNPLNSSVVKAIFNNMEQRQPGRAIYFSRSFIPHYSDFFYSHIGIYIYRYNAIRKFVSLPQSFLERTEKLEQLRALQNDFNMWAVPVFGKAFSVDMKEDLNALPTL
jgi:3-deoxy-manno-octulosonate cytidylyltransferase (CMP-KDO synthetase)